MSPTQSEIVGFTADSGMLTKQIRATTRSLTVAPRQEGLHQ